MSRGGAMTAPQPLALRILGVVQGLADHRLVDRLIRGRMWIVILGTGLIGIVFMQVSMLRMNTGIGRAVEQAATLERQNAAAQANISEMTSSERVQAAATRAGMVASTDATAHFLDASRLDIRDAVRGITSPSTTPPAVNVAATPAAATATPAASATAQPSVQSSAAAATATTASPTVASATQTTAGATATQTQTPTQQTVTPTLAPQSQTPSVAGGAAAVSGG